MARVIKFNNTGIRGTVDDVLRVLANDDPASVVEVNGCTIVLTGKPSVAQVRAVAKAAGKGNTVKR